MSNHHTLAADHLSDQASAFAVALWDALSKIPLQNKRDTFESAVQMIAQNVAGCEAANLVEASAMLAAADQFKHRAETIRNEAEEAHDEYVRFLQDEHAQETADHRYEMAREMMGAV